MPIDDEAPRAALLRRLAVLETCAEPAFDAQIQVAQSVFGVASALLSLLDGERLWFKARAGFQSEQAPSAGSFCQHALNSSDRVLVVRDALNDARFRSFLAVTGPPFLRFYAGAPIVVEGIAIGVLCVFDPSPRPQFDAQGEALLAAMATTTQELLRLRLETAERRERERALEVARRKMALGEELAGVGHWTLDVETGRVAWSEHVYRIHGLQPNGADPPLEQALSFYEDASRDLVEAHVARALSTGEGFACKARLRRASDGASRIVLSRGEPLEDAETGRRTLFGVFQDVTEQEELLQEVSRDRERYKLLTQNSNDVIATYKPDGTFTYLSPSVDRLVGCSAEDLIGHKTFEIIHPDDHQRVLAEFRALLASGVASARIEYRALRAGGETVWAEAHPSPVYDTQGKLTGFHDVVRDISARKAAEQAAEEAAERAAQAYAGVLEFERRYRLLAENTTDMITRFSPEGWLRYVSPSSERVLGFAPEEMVGRRTLDFIHPGDVDHVTAQHLAFVAGGPGAPQIETRFRAIRKDGSVIWLEGRPAIAFDSDGSPEEMYDVVRDVTARKRLEEELETARVAAEAGAQAKSDFLANMSHELRTPLTAVLGFARLIDEQEELSDRSRSYVNRVQTAGRALLATVNDVLDFSKLEAGQVELCPWPTDPAELAQEVLDLFEAQAAAKGLRLAFQVEGQLPGALEIDPDRVRQVLTNFVGNAIKFTAAGHVTICASYKAARLRLEVVDTGEGIPASRLGVLFQRFSQADASTTRRHGGTGLGLAICKGLAEAMGGEVGATSVEGLGSVFWCELPGLSVDAAAQPLGEADSSAELEGGHRLLLADDNPVNRELVKAMLASYALKIYEAETGEDAVQLAGDVEFDLILMDLHMPGMGGHAAARVIRSRTGPNATTPILAFSADVLQPDMTAFDGMISKPIAPRELLGSLSAFLGSRGREAPDLVLDATRVA